MATAIFITGAASRRLSKMLHCRELFTSDGTMLGATYIVFKQSVRVSH